MKQLLLSVVLLFSVSASADPGGRPHSFQQTEAYEILARGYGGIEITHKPSGQRLIIHKKNADRQVYETGDDPANSSVFRYTAARLYHNRLLIALRTENDSAGSGIDVVRFKEGEAFRVIRHVEMENIRALSLLEEEDLHALVLLKGSEEKGFSFEIFETDLDSHWIKRQSLPLPYADIYDFALTARRKLYNGSHRYYLILTRLNGRPVLCSLKSLVDQTPLEIISEITLEGHASLLDLEQTEEDDLLTMIYPDESREQFSVDELLSDAFAQRRGRHEAMKKKHASEMKAYRQSSHYKWIKFFAALDSFVRGFIPFDYDLAPKALNTYVMQTTPERLLRDELVARDLLNELTPDEAVFFSRDIRRIRDASETAGVIALVSIPVSKGIKAYRAYRAARPEKLAQLTGALAKLEKRLGGLKSGEKAVRITESRIAAFKSAEALLKKPIYLKLGPLLKNALRQGFNVRTAKMFPKVLLVTNATWLLGGEVPVQVKRHGLNPTNWEVDGHKLAYTGLFLNDLTGAIMVLSGFKMNQLTRMVVLMGTIEVNSWFLQWLIYRNEDIPFDPAQAAFDKGYVVAYALPKNQLNYWLQPRLVDTAKAAGYSAGVYEWFIPLSMNVTNEILGNGGYAWTKDAGVEMIGSRIEEMENLHAFDLEDYLNQKACVIVEITPVSPLDLNELQKR